MLANNATNEMAHSILRKEFKGVIYKIDFAKDFDSINWHFLKEAMRCMKFPEKWIRWMSSFFSTARPSIMINGSPIKEFQMNQGLRQEDPLSPLLFHIVGEMLHLFLEKSSTVGIFEGISVGTNIIVSHLQFSYDTILFVKDDYASIQKLEVALKLFELASGLKINLHKSFCIVQKIMTPQLLIGLRFLVVTLALGRYNNWGLLLINPLIISFFGIHWSWGYKKDRWNGRILTFQLLEDWSF